MFPGIAVITFANRSGLIRAVESYSGDAKPGSEAMLNARDVDRRVARLEGILVGHAQASATTRKRAPHIDIQVNLRPVQANSAARDDDVTARGA